MVVECVGLNRTLGTLMASLLALAVDVLGDYMGSYEKYFLFICTFLGGAIPTMFKFRRPFRDRWNYAVVMSMITFHLLILTQSDEKIKLPLLRLGLIAIGFVIASLVNIILLPNFAGNNINELLATNFERAGNVVEKCVLEYCQGTVLQQLPEVLSQAANDELHSCFHEIVATDSEVEKLVRFFALHSCKMFLKFQSTCPFLHLVPVYFSILVSTWIISFDFNIKSVTMSLVFCSVEGSKI